MLPNKRGDDDDGEHDDGEHDDDGGDEARETLALELVRSLWARGTSADSAARNLGEAEHGCHSRLMDALDRDVLVALDRMASGKVLRDGGRDLGFAWKGLMSDKDWLLGGVETWCVFGNQGCMSAGFLDGVRKLAKAVGHREAEAVPRLLERARERRRNGQRGVKGRAREWTKDDAVQALEEWNYHQNEYHSRNEDQDQYHSRDEDEDEDHEQDHDQNEDRNGQRRARGAVRKQQRVSRQVSRHDSDISDIFDSSEGENDIDIDIEMGRAVDDVADEADVGRRDFLGDLHIDAPSGEDGFVDDTALFSPSSVEHRHRQRPLPIDSSRTSPQVDFRAQDEHENDILPRSSSPPPLSKMPPKRGWTADDMPAQLENRCKIPRLGTSPDEDADATRRYVALAQEGFNTLMGEKCDQREGRAIAWNNARKVGVSIAPARTPAGDGVARWALAIVDVGRGDIRVFGAEDGGGDGVDLERLRTDMLALDPDLPAAMNVVEVTLLTPVTHCSTRASMSETSFIVAFAAAVMALAGQDISEYIDVHVWFHAMLSLSAERETPPVSSELPSFDRDAATDSEETVAGTTTPASMSAIDFLAWHERLLEARFQPVEAHLQGLQGFLRALAALHEVHQWAVARRSKSLVIGDDSLMSNHSTDSDDDSIDDTDGEIEAMRMELQAQIDMYDTLIQKGGRQIERWRRSRDKCLADLEEYEKSSVGEARTKTKVQRREWKDLVDGRMDRLLGFVEVMKSKGKNASDEVKHKADKLSRRLEKQAERWVGTFATSVAVSE